MPGVAGDDVPSGVGALKFASPQAAKYLHLAHAQHHQIGVAVAVDVQRIRAVGIGQLKPAALLHELYGTTARAFIAIELGTVHAGRHINFGQAVTIAIEGGHTTAHQKFALAFEPALKSRGIGFFNKARNAGCLSLCTLRGHDHDCCQRNPDGRTNQAASL